MVSLWLLCCLASRDRYLAWVRESGEDFWRGLDSDFWRGLGWDIIPRHSVQQSKGQSFMRHETKSCHEEQDVTAHMSGNHEQQ